MATHKVWMNVGSMPTFKAIDIELAEETLVFERPKVGRQDLGGKDLNVGDLEAIATGKPLNGRFKSRIAFNALKHFMDAKGEFKGCGLWVVERKNECVSEWCAKDMGVLVQDHNVFETYPWLSLFLGRRFFLCLGGGNCCLQELMMCLQYGSAGNSLSRSWSRDGSLRQWTTRMVLIVHIDNVNGLINLGEPIAVGQWLVHIVVERRQAAATHRISSIQGQGCE